MLPAPVPTEVHNGVDIDFNKVTIQSSGSPWVFSSRKLEEMQAGMRVFVRPTERPHLCVQKLRSPLVSSNTRKAWLEKLAAKGFIK